MVLSWFFSSSSASSSASSSDPAQNPRSSSSTPPTAPAHDEPSTVPARHAIVGSSSIKQDGEEEWTLSSSKSKVPIWLPVAAFVGTSLALAIPMVMVRRQRTALSLLARQPLHPSTSSSSSTSAAAPPRRGRLAPSTSSPSATTARLKSISSPSPSSQQTVSFKMDQLPEGETSPGLGDLMSAMSRLNLSTALWAGKAFAIATGFVVLGGVGTVWGVKHLLGVEDTREFGVRARAFLWSAWPSLPSSIHRPPSDAGERREGHAVAPFEAEERWKWDEAEQRLKKAYEEGGFPLWARAALREMEAEARVERRRREREVEELDSGNKA